MWSLTQSCWAQIASDRPSLHQICQTLAAIVEAPVVGTANAEPIASEFQVRAEIAREPSAEIPPPTEVAVTATTSTDQILMTLSGIVGTPVGRTVDPTDDIATTSSNRIIDTMSAIVGVPLGRTVDAASGPVMSDPQAIAEDVRDASVEMLHPTDVAAITTTERSSLPVFKVMPSPPTRLSFPAAKVKLWERSLSELSETIGTLAIVPSVHVTDMFHRRVESLTCPSLGYFVATNSENVELLRELCERISASALCARRAITTLTSEFKYVP